jgi:hypothetical protein
LTVCKTIYTQAVQINPMYRGIVSYLHIITNLKFECYSFDGGLIASL